MSRTGLQRPMLYRVHRKDGSSFVAEVTANSQLDDPVVQGLAVYVRRWDERHLLDQVIESLASATSLDATLELLTQVMGAETLDGDGFVMFAADPERVRADGQPLADRPACWPADPPRKQPAVEAGDHTTRTGLPAKRRAGGAAPNAQPANAATRGVGVGRW